MPNLNEFINSEPEVPDNLEKFDGPKPCKHCDKDSQEYYWNPVTLEMTWNCPDGHKNSYRIN